MGGQVANVADLLSSLARDSDPVPTSWLEQERIPRAAAQARVRAVLGHPAAR